MVDNKKNKNKKNINNNSLDKNQRIFSVILAALLVFMFLFSFGASIFLLVSHFKSDSKLSATVRSDFSSSVQHGPIMASPPASFTVNGYTFNSNSYYYISSIPNSFPGKFSSAFLNTDIFNPLFKYSVTLASGSSDEIVYSSPIKFTSSCTYGGSDYYMIVTFQLLITTPYYKTFSSAVSSSTPLTSSYTVSKRWNFVRITSGSGGLSGNYSFTGSNSINGRDLGGASLISPFVVNAFDAYLFSCLFNLDSPGEYFSVYSEFPAGEGTITPSDIENARQEGYQEGYENGVNVGASNTYTSPLTLVIQPIEAFFNTPFFGVSNFTIGSLLAIVLFVSIAIIFLRIFAGG